MLKQIWKILTIVGLLAFAFMLFWMNRFQYEHTGTTQVLVRINRFTGQECYLTTDRGWDSRLILPAKSDDKTDDFAQYLANQGNKDNCR
jgi:hypothetical protein